MPLFSAKPIPARGSSGLRADRYALGFSLEDSLATAEERAVQRKDYEALLGQAAALPGGGRNVILSTGRTRPSSVYVENVQSLASHSREVDALGGARTFVVSWKPSESNLTDEQYLAFARDAVRDVGLGDHPNLYVVHRDEDHVHVHIVTSRLNPLTLRAPKLDYEMMAEMSRVTRELEIKHDMEAGQGIFVRRTASDGTMTVEKATQAERSISWSKERARTQAAQARRIVAARDKPGDRYDRIVERTNDYLADCREREEDPLHADVALIAARQGAAYERDATGRLALRLSTGTSTPGKLLAVDYRHFEATSKERSFLDEMPEVNAQDRYFSAIENDPGRVASDIIFAGKATFTEADLHRHLSERLEHPEDVREAVDLVLDRDDEIVELQREGEEPLYSTSYQVELERRVQGLAGSMAGDRGDYDRAKLDEAIASANVSLDDEQRAVIERVAQRGFVVYDSPAGSGKTAIAETLRAYAQATGRPIIGLGPSQTAAVVLEEKSGIESENFDRALAQEASSQKFAHDRNVKNVLGAAVLGRPLHPVTEAVPMIPKNAIVYADEGSMLSLRHAEETLCRVKAAGGGVVLAGDFAQLPSGSAGDAFRLLARVAEKNGDLIRGSIVYRHGDKVEWMREASPLVKRAIDHGDGHGVRVFLNEAWDKEQVVSHSSKDEMLTAQAADVVNAERSGQHIIARTHKKHDALKTNRLIRDELGLTGKGEPYRTTSGEREFAEGDFVKFTKNDHKLGVRNGDTGVVRVADGEKLGIELRSGRRVSVGPRHIEYAWVQTHHSAQGNSADLAVPTLGWGDDARMMYSAVTRAEGDLRVHTMISREEFVEHFSSDAALRQKDSALLIEMENERERGWVKRMRTLQPRRERERSVGLSLG